MIEEKNLGENQTELECEPQNQPNTKSKKFNTALAVLLGVLFFLISFASGFFANYLLRGKEANVAYDLVAIMKNVGYIYDPTTNERREITEKDVADALVNALLDRYARYYTKEEYAEVTEKAKGNYKGVGVMFSDNSTTIRQVVGNSPAYHSGIKGGDVLLKGQVQEDVKVFENNQQISDFINKYPIGTEFVFDIDRGGNILQIKAVKKSYVASYVVYYDNQYKCEFVSDSGAPKKSYSQNQEMSYLDDDVAYVKLLSFEGGATWQMGQVLEFMNTRGKTKLILDLRDNGGGYMSVLTHIASYFISNGNSSKSAVAIAEGKTGKEVYYTDINRYQSFVSSIAVLGNEDTASASECLIGAIKTYNKNAIVIVEKNDKGVAKTYGKGIMQTTYQLISGGAFKLTTARITWPDSNRTCINGVGVTTQTVQGVKEAEKGNAINVALAELSKA